jgi:transcriptional regulator CtsR
MDDFDVQSERGTGTTITMTKWRVRDELELLRERRRLLDEKHHGKHRSDGAGP